MRAALLLVVLALAGCCTTKPAVTVEIPVKVGCLGDRPTKPVAQFGIGTYPVKPDGKDDDKKAAQIALADASAWEGYATKLEVMSAGCDPAPKAGLGHQ